MSNYLIPKLVVIDPLYCRTMPAGLTVESGIDALAHHTCSHYFVDSQASIEYQYLAEVSFHQRIWRNKIMHHQHIKSWQHQHMFNIEKKAIEKRTLIVVIITFVMMIQVVWVVRTGDRGL
jgi:alcohol dehydrogenase YqhD (iron-dependent ADH family)